MKMSRRAEHLKYRYGITELRYEQMLEDQGGACAVCGVLNPGSHSPYFHVDHDHDCCPGTDTCGECLRGLLCQNCNHALGKLRDDIDTIKAAAKYVTKHKRKRESRANPTP